MYVLLLILHLLICVGLIGVVLVQSGKGGGLAGGAFGGSAQTVLGGRGATDLITRATMVLGGAFFITSLVLALMSSGFGRTSRSVIQSEARKSVPGVPSSVPGQGPAGQMPASGSAPTGATVPGAGAPTGATAPTGGSPSSATAPGGSTPAAPGKGTSPPSGGTVPTPPRGGP